MSPRPRSSPWRTVWSIRGRPLSMEELIAGFDPAAVARVPAARRETPFRMAGRINNLLGGTILGNLLGTLVATLFARLRERARRQ